ncbi:MAG: hypothetical protein V1748_10250 [Actinomycetota bacterium]
MHDVESRYPEVNAMKRIAVPAIIVPLLVLAGMVSGCGGSGGSTTPATTPATTPSSSGGSIEVLGTWIIQGQSADVYHLTFYPDNTYVMAYDGQSHKGTYAVESGSVTIDDPRMTFATVEGPEMSRDKLIETRGTEKIEWIRV